MNAEVERAVVLLVDDTPINLTLLDKTLGGDYTLRFARSGQEALDSAFSAPPDLILLDVMMPGMDGFEVCRQLKENTSTRHVPVIFITAKTDWRDEEQGFSLGAADFIHKPISVPIVSARVKTHLKVKFMQDFLMRENERLQDQYSTELDQLRSFIWGKGPR